MKCYIVHLSDAGRADRRAPVVVRDETSVGKMTQLLLDEFLAEHEGRLQFPLFVDIHLAEEPTVLKWAECLPRPR